MKVPCVFTKVALVAQPFTNPMVDPQEFNEHLVTLDIVQRVKVYELWDIRRQANTNIKSIGFQFLYRLDSFTWKRRVLYVYLLIKVVIRKSESVLDVRKILV